VWSLYRCALWHLHLPRRPQALTCPRCESGPPLPADSSSSRRLFHASCLSTSTSFVSCFFRLFHAIVLLTFIPSFSPTSVEDQPFTHSRLSTHTHYCRISQNRLQHQPTRSLYPLTSIASTYPTFDSIDTKLLRSAYISSNKADITRVLFETGSLALHSLPITDISNEIFEISYTQGRKGRSL